MSYAYLHFRSRPLKDIYTTCISFSKGETFAARDALEQWTNASNVYTSILFEAIHGFLDAT